MAGIYLEPIALLYGAVAKEALAEGVALPLAGGPIAFAAVRLWEGAPGDIKHAIARTATIQAIDDHRIKELLDTITAPRLPIAGVPMDGPHIMGVVNVTPDSFSEKGEHFEPDAAVRHAHKLVADGADFIDLGGESTRPGANPTAVEEELRRVTPVLRDLQGLSAPVSIDTRKPQIMREAAKEGAALINDVSALTFAADSMSTAAELKLPVILMHAKGEPKTMQDRPSYRDVVIEVYDYLAARIEAAVAAGLSRSALVADPGIGFGKSPAHNIALLGSITLFHGLGVPLLVGTSRKGFIQKLAGVNEPFESVAGSVAACIDAASQGVQILRVHDARASRQALAIWSSFREA